MSNDKTAFDVSLGKATSGFTKLLRELGADGKQVIEKLDDDPAYARRVARYMQSGGYSPSTDQKRARDIMGSNFLGVEDIIKHFGISLTDDEVSLLRDIRFTEAQLQECKDTHVLFPGYPLSILEIRDRVPNAMFYSQDWYNDEKFTKKEKVGLHWYLIRKDIVENSTSKTYQEQTALLTSNEEVPRACEVIYLIMLYFLAYQKRLFEKVYARCSNLSSDGNRVDVGNFDAKGLYVYSNWDDYRLVYLGVSSRRK
ncbi:MAG: hypothetical protein AAB424_02360 [Patescibacteria group bacterium]